MTLEDSLKRKLNIIGDSIRLLKIQHLRDSFFVYEFINYNKNSKLHEKLKKFRFVFDEIDTSYFNYEYQNQKKPVKIIKIPKRLQKKWIPIYKYENEFYVFMDCDFQTGFELTDTAAIFFNMDGAFPRLYSGYKSSKGSDKIFTTDNDTLSFTLLQEKDSIYKVKNYYKCVYYTSYENINKFPIIYMDCPSIWRNLIEFDKVNCE
ncbi:MAG: hypothetical protein ACXWDO_06885 [Bacteroidia bacterium]